MCHSLRLQNKIVFHGAFLRSRDVSTRDCETLHEHLCNEPGILLVPLALLVHLGLQCSVTRLCLASDQVHVLLVLCSDGRRAVSAVTGDGEFGCQACVGGDKNMELMGQLG